jgi:integrase/recombinase XerD
MDNLSRAELINTLRVARTDSERNYIALLCAYSHALRAGEVVRLTTANLRDGRVTVSRLKGSLRTSQPFVRSSEELLDEAGALPAYLAKLRPGSRLLPVTTRHLYRLFSRYAAAAGVSSEKRHPHVLKHTRARLLLAGGASLPVIREYLGHRSLASTGEYLRLTEEEVSAAVSAIDSSI